MSLSVGMAEKPHGNRRHGLSQSFIFHRWWQMQERCYNKKNQRYKRYGGRGIRVCKRWRGDNGLQNFVEDMGFPSTRNHTLDRKDNNGNYTPDNCRWTTAYVQARNTSNARQITWKRQTHCLAEWEEITGISRFRIASRLHRGWSVSRTLSTPVLNRGA